MHLKKQSHFIYFIIFLGDLLELSSGLEPQMASHQRLRSIAFQSGRASLAAGAL